MAFFWAMLSKVTGVVLVVIKGLLSMQSQGGGATTATLAGSLNATGDVTASNISLNSHTHPGDSGGTTGGPQ